MSKLIELVKSQITKKDDQKALEKAERDVKTAANGFRNEVFAMETARDAAKDELEAVVSNVSSTASDIIAAQDALAIAERNVTEATKIQAERF